MIYRFIKVKNDLYRGSAPSIEDVISLHKLYKIQRIVSLDLYSALIIKEICKLLSIEHVIIPINADRKSLMKLLSFNLKDLLNSGVPTYVHCREGKDRTGLVIALFKCKYMKMSPIDAINEAESLGFGVGIPEQITNLYKKIIMSCKQDNDLNDADIVSNLREYVGDEKDSPLDRADRGSFAPYLDKTKQYPYDAVYRDDNGFSREDAELSITNDVNQIPNVGLSDETRGMGPVDMQTGFVNI